MQSSSPLSSFFIALHLQTYEEARIIKFESAIDAALHTLPPREKTALLAYLTVQLRLNETSAYYKKIWDEAQPMFFLSGKNAYKDFFIYIFDKLNAPNTPSTIRF